MTSIPTQDYSIHFNTTGYSKLNELIKNNDYSSIFILVDSNTNANCLTPVLQHIETDIRIEILEIESGEQHKNLDTWYRPKKPND